MADRLKQFAEAIASRKTQVDVLDEDTMRAIATDLGMSEQEILDAKLEGQTRKTAAQNLKQRGLIDEAIAELEQAFPWNPLDTEIQTLLADCYIRRGRKLNIQADLEKARELCLQVLSVAPKNKEASALLQVIQMNPVNVAPLMSRIPLLLGLVSVVATIIWLLLR